MSPSSRPLSPHLQIYRLPLVALTSIAHRFAGLALVAGVVVLVWWLVAAATGPDAYALVQAVLGSILGRLVLFGFTAALFYHLCNGIRHLLWDVGRGFELSQAQAGSRVVIAASVVLTLVAWIAALV